MEIFRRHKDFAVDWDEAGGHFQVTVRMEDHYHDIEVAVVFAYPDLTIQSVQPHMRRTPYPVCPSALAQAQACVGMKVQAGLQLMLQRQIGGATGCSHVTQLVLDACHAAVQGLLAIQSRREGGAPPQMPAPEKIAFLEAHHLSIRDSCTAYATTRGERGDG